MSLKVDELAQQIVALGPLEQEELLERVADLNFQRGLEALSQKYRERLAAAGKLNQKADDVMAELGQIREGIAAHEYRK
ncbi:MAG: hypothetical protein EXS64_10420 [Candidatus Latescibacteria bacterium]|nr:hypothetical protein [Candidatus Latescibacterota bacterium]